MACPVLRRADGGRRSLPVRRMASATAGITALCLLVAVVHVGRLPATRTEVCVPHARAYARGKRGAWGLRVLPRGCAAAQPRCILLTRARAQAIDLGYQYVDPQAQMGVVENAVQLPDFGEQGTNNAFLNKGDGSGQSTKDRAHFQQLAVKQVCALLRPCGRAPCALTLGGRVTHGRVCARSVEGGACVWRRRSRQSSPCESVADACSQPQPRAHTHASQVTCRVEPASRKAGSTRQDVPPHLRCV